MTKLKYPFRVTLRAENPRRHLRGTCYAIGKRSVAISVPCGDLVVCINTGRDSEWQLSRTSHCKVLRTANRHLTEQLEEEKKNHARR